MKPMSLKLPAMVPSTVAVDPVPYLDLRKPRNSPSNVASPSKRSEPENVTTLPEKPERLPVTPRKTSNVTADSNVSGEQQSNGSVPAFKTAKDTQKALSKAREAITKGSLKPSVRQIAEHCSVGTKKAQWIRTELAREGAIQVKGSGRATVAKPEVNTDVVKALEGLKFTKSEAAKFAEKATGETLNEQINSALKLAGSKK